jgi:hypothetical protein
VSPLTLRHPRSGYRDEWLRLGEGEVSSVKEQGIEQLLAKLSQNQQITGAMVDGAMQLVREYRELQDRQLAEAGIIEGVLAE